MKYSCKSNVRVKRKTLLYVFHFNLIKAEEIHKFVSNKYDWNLNKENKKRKIKNIKIIE